MSIYTLGPWDVRPAVCKHDHPETSADVYSIDGEFVANCGCHARAKGNARLIAAAPQMLKALIRAKYKLNAYVGVCKDDKELTDTVLPMVRAAIDSATPTPSESPTRSAGEGK